MLNIIMNRADIRQVWLVVIIVLCGTTLQIAKANVYAEKGLQIAKERKKRDMGWGDSISEVIMTLRNAEGKESIRKMRMKNLEVIDDGDKGLTVFDQPRDVKGTAFLNYSHPTEPDDQWLYLPALKRVKRIASRNKSGPFMGSEFAYEDLTSFEIEKYRYAYLKEEVLNDVNCFVVEQYPLDDFSGYKRLVVWVDQQHYRPFKVEYFDKKNSLLKSLLFKDYKRYLNKYWRAATMEMMNHQTGKVTELKTLRLEFNTGLNKQDFDKSSLKRVR